MGTTSYLVRKENLEWKTYRTSCSAVYWNVNGFWLSHPIHLKPESPLDGGSILQPVTINMGWWITTEIRATNVKKSLSVTVCTHSHWEGHKCTHAFTKADNIETHKDIQIQQSHIMTKKEQEQMFKAVGGYERKTEHKMQSSCNLHERKR